MKAQLLRPGFMVALRSVCKGGVEYESIDHEAEVIDAKLTQKLESIKTVEDIDEHAEAVKVRGLAVYQVRRFCVKTPFTLLCPKANEAQLDEGYAAAKFLVDQFNEKSVYTKISIYMLKGQLASDDEQAASAMAAEMRSLLAEVGEAIRNMDPDKIREALTKADEVSEMLVEEEQNKVSGALEMARVAAREIKKTIKKQGIQAINVARDYQVELIALQQASANFLDFEEPAKVSVEAPGVQVMDLDLSDEDEATPPPAQKWLGIPSF